VPELVLGKNLGDWEASEIHGLLCIQSGIYSSEETTKARGMKPENLKDEGISLRKLLMQKVLPAWRSEATPCVEFLQKEYVTAGSAVASFGRFPIIGAGG
jgi:hypothetical protein